MKVYIVRHGETDWNTEKRLQGRQDIPLNENGREVARKTAQGIRQISFHAAFSSPLSRAKETAQILLEGRETPICLDDRLLEISFGVMEGERKDPVIDCFFHSPEKYEPPKDAESIPHLLERTKAFLDDLASNTKLRDKSLLVITHGAATRALLANVKKLSLKDFWDGSVPKNCGMTLLEWKDGQYHAVWEDRVFYDESL